MPGLQGKIALVTGASRGIGRATALRLARDGATVAIHYGNAAGHAEKVVTEIEAAGGCGFAVQADFTDRRAPWRLFELLDAELRRRFGDTKFDILVNNAAATGGMGVVEEVAEADFDRLVAVNLRAPFFLIQLASPRLRAGGRIINLSSSTTRVAYPAMAAYAPTKAALDCLTLHLAAHFGPRGITVNSVAPGATATERTPPALDPVLAKKLAETIALRRVGQPDDIAEVIAFLASEGGGWITGQRIDASGGQKI